METMHPHCPIGEIDHERHTFSLLGQIRRCEGFVEIGGYVDWRETGWTGR